MNNNRKKINRGFIVLNQGERIAVISLLWVIAILLAFSVFRPMLPASKKDRMAFHNLDSLIAVREQALREQQEREESERARQKEEKTKGYYSSETSTGSQRKHSTSPGGTSTPPKTTNVCQPSSSQWSGPKESRKIPTLDLNLADSTELVALPQIGAVMASRIHRYRERLGGFVCLEQLYEVRGMDTARYNTVTPYLLLESREVRRLNVNQEEFKTLLRHPYLEYEQVKALVSHRERKGLIKDWEQVKGLTGEVNPLLERYLVY